MCRRDWQGSRDICLAISVKIPLSYHLTGAYARPYRVVLVSASSLLSAPAQACRLPSDRLVPQVQQSLSSLPPKYPWPLREPIQKAVQAEEEVQPREEALIGTGCDISSFSYP